MGSAKLSENGHQMDVIWGHLKPKLPYLSKIDESVLVVPYSNSSEERVLFIIWKNMTEFRPWLNLGKSLIVFPLIRAPGTNSILKLLGATLNRGRR